MTTTSLPAAGAPASASARTPRRSRAAHSAGFWTAVLAFAIAMAFSTIPTPICALYQQRDGFSPIVVTVIFAAYAVGVAVALGALAAFVIRGEELAAIFLIAYVGLAVPTLLIGAALAWLALPVVLGVFAGLMLVLISVATPRMVRRLAA
ncbi:MAG: hypothetical protein BGN98_07380 [Microbacterium sp. 69-7]|uniref:hypothetical protein n=1 Tax=unclassified Microbacterium TaxID=2609290 RepID=UPI00086DAEAE|nr:MULTISPECIES: hypothetical protein [unclassified Microbacterium]ODT23616.1 MAG: hypothetical protein ABS64_08745 [Microbacterium sp. SCN 69-37]OJU47441.1 MAG: hypothetical protein BGN98_07380 [Microbacterium sp. 69-7]